MKVPMVHPELVKAATAIVLAENSCLIAPVIGEDGTTYESEATFSATREAASAYLIACFDFGATAIDESETLR